MTVKNIYSDESDVYKAKAVFEQYEKDNIVEIRPISRVPREWVIAKQPLIIV